MPDDRGTAALIKNEKYEDILVERINQITIDSEKLMKSMNISHMIGNRQGMGTLIQGMYQHGATVRNGGSKEEWKSQG